ncbi:hypothetical protein [Brachyspira catarrhinii]|uniref:Uncharacterized protein n=1 Tax=Brachyspira catarrhinii TaxID=2528966 RepID=A0ABY2TSI4_9SPIR|nr:hypothetical protein [Brachyspira catarrhinii]TKZ35837.1 hypothetical protein EZH24_03160 [Brachyspira catarrhinii]
MNELPIEIIIAVAVLIIIAVAILIKVLIYKNSKASYLEKSKTYEEIEGVYFNKSANTNIKIKHIEDNKFYIEGYYNDKRIIHGSISHKQSKSFKGKRNTFSFKINDNYLEILIKDKNCLYVEYKTMNNIDNNIKALQGIYERNLN